MIFVQTAYKPCPTKNPKPNPIEAKRLRKIRDKLGIIIINWKKEHGCSHCGLKHDNPGLFDFHHIDPSTKTISQLIKSLNTRETVLEIQKCILLCSNCHRNLHWNMSEHPEKYIKMLEKSLKAAPNFLKALKR